MSLTAERPHDRNVLLLVHYDGTDFAGWQFQNDQRTVQGVLEDALEKMVHHKVTAHASSRTDAGVHAKGLPVSFETSRSISPYGFMRGLSSILMPDVAITDARDVPLGWRPRGTAVAKTYSYVIQLGLFPLPLSRTRAWCPGYPDLDLPAMQEAAKLLEGQHDFAAFRAAKCDSKSTLRLMHSLEISPVPGTPHLRLVLTGSSFLRKMVRIIAGTLVEVGTGRRAPESILHALESGDRRDAGQTAPGHGLTLEEVHFDGYPRMGRPAPEVTLP